MKLALLQAPRQLVVVDEPVPEVGPEEVLVRVTNCGVCASELDIWDGRSSHAAFPWYPGHEVSGVVERVGQEVTSFRADDPVAVWVTERGYAEYVSVKDEYCLPAGDVPLEQALGEPLACAVNAVNLADISLGDDVVIVGAGFMGHLIQKLVMLRGPGRVIVADIREDALERAKTLGATVVVNVALDSLAEAVADLTQGAGADVCFEVTGAQAPLSLMSQVTRMSGTLVIAGYHQGEPRQIPLGEWNWKAFRIANAHFREPSTIIRGMRMGMRLLTSGRLSLDGLVTHSFPLEQVEEAFQTAMAKPDGFVKATVYPRDGRA